MKWTPRDTAQQLQRLTRHTSMVQASKYALIGVAALLILMVFLVPVLHDDDSGARLVFTNVEETGGLVAPRMNQPHLQGLDKNNQPYTVTADMAEQMDDGTVRLTNIQADITLNNGTWLAFHGRTGIFDAEADTLLLPESVQVFHDAGYDMRSTHVLLDLGAATASGDRKVDGQGPLGRISASGFRVDSEAGTIRFAPDVTVTLYPRSKP